MKQNIDIVHKSRSYDSSDTSINVSDNEYDYYLVGTSWYTAINRINASYRAYIGIEQNINKLLVSQAYPTIDNETDSNGIQRLFLIKANKTNNNINIKLLDGIDAYFVCGINKQ